MINVFIENLRLKKFEISFLNKKGYLISNDFSHCEIGIFTDPIKFPKNFYGVKVIYVQEPEVVRPDLYTKKKLKKYDFIIAASQKRAIRIKADFVLPFPINLPKYTKKQKTRLKKGAIVNGNKFSGSKRSMYGLRRQVIIKSENTNYSVDVYGDMWSDGKFIEIQRRIYALRKQLVNRKPVDLRESFSNLFQKYQNIKGIDKTSDCEKLQNYNFSIVIENDLDYISEKIWKSIYSGAVPIYIGLHEELDPKVIDCIYIAKPSVTEIMNIIHNLNEVDLKLKRIKGHKLLSNLAKNNKLDFTKNLCQILDTISLKSLGNF